MDHRDPFIAIARITAENANTSTRSSLKNMVMGPGRGFSTSPPFDCLSTRQWSTATTGRRSIPYFDRHPDPIVIDLHLAQAESFDAIGLWAGLTSIGKAVRDFTLQFSRDGSVADLSAPLARRAREHNPHDLEVIAFPRVEAQMVRLTLLSNRSHGGAPANRVCLREVTLIRDHRAVRDALANRAGDGVQGDVAEAVLGSRMSAFERAVVLMRPEFALDGFWKPDCSYTEFLRFRGYSSGGGQLRRIDLARWADKIYTHHFLKEHGIEGMPILLHSRYLNADFIDRLKALYYAGLRSFVVKVSHLAFGEGVFRVRDGRFIAANEHGAGGGRVGSRVDFDYLYTQLREHWERQQFTEEWACNVLAPGVIVEELIDEPLELKFSVVFGEVVGFFTETPGLPTFDQAGAPLSDAEHVPPPWWREGRRLAERVAERVRADHIRIDVFRHRGAVVVCEITWNGVEMEPLHERIAQRLNRGYALRRRYLQRLRRSGPEPVATVP